MGNNMLYDRCSYTNRTQTMSQYKLTPSVQSIFDYIKAAKAVTPKMIIANTDDETMQSLEPVLRGLKKMDVIARKDGKWSVTEKAAKILV